MTSKEEDKKFVVKCLGWCEKEFKSESKFLRFCPKCKEKKENIYRSNSIFNERKICDS